MLDEVFFRTRFWEFSLFDILTIIYLAFFADIGLFNGILFWIAIPVILAIIILSETLRRMVDERIKDRQRTDS